MKNKSILLTLALMSIIGAGQINGAAVTIQTGPAANKSDVVDRLAQQLVDLSNHAGGSLGDFKKELLANHDVINKYFWGWTLLLYAARQYENVESSQDKAVMADLAEAIKILIDNGADRTLGMGGMYPGFDPGQTFNDTLKKLPSLAQRLREMGVTV